MQRSPLTHRGLQLCVTRCDENIDELGLACSKKPTPEDVRVRVTWTGEIAEDIITLVFENRQKTGGGPITNIEMDENEMTAVISYENVAGTS